MKTPAFNTTLLFYPNKNPKLRLFALWYFTILMIVWNILATRYLGFEQSGDAVRRRRFGDCLAIVFGMGGCPATDRELRFAGGWDKFLNFLPAALIPGFACAMLLYPTNRLWPVVFAEPSSIGSKVLFRAPVGRGADTARVQPVQFRSGG